MKRLLGLLLVLGTVGCGGGHWQPIDCLDPSHQLRQQLVNCLTIVKQVARTNLAVIRNHVFASPSTVDSFRHVSRSCGLLSGIFTLAVT